MVLLPETFTESCRQTMGDALFERYMRSFDEPVPVSIRTNPAKTGGGRRDKGDRGSDSICGRFAVAGGKPVPWCRNGYYLSERPAFTMDPLLHAGCYYVQEAASMFLDEVLRQYLPAIAGEDAALNALDMCAAPGGKTTLLWSALPAGSTLYANEPVRQRASVLAENCMKWCGAEIIVTNNYPADYVSARMLFDVILCDVPCSGEGMFRKDAQTIQEWSEASVQKCARLGREIVADAWRCLRDGGLLVFSTCTLNTHENEENVRWLISELGAEVLPVEVQPEWNITGSLLPGFAEPVYRFIPGVTQGEGLFMAVLRKPGHAAGGSRKAAKGILKTVDAPLLYDAALPSVELSYQQAMAFLRREALTLPQDAPRGLLTVCFGGFPLGQVKNIGTRANNLYPKEWKIKTTHVPSEYSPTLIPITDNR